LAAPPVPAGDLTALPHTPSWIKGSPLLSEGGGKEWRKDDGRGRKEGRRRKEGRGRRGEEGRRGGEGEGEERKGKVG